MEAKNKKEIQKRLLHYIYSVPFDVFFESCFGALQYRSIFNRALQQEQPCAFFFCGDEEGWRLKQEFDSCSNREWIMMVALLGQELQHLCMYRHWREELVSSLIEEFSEEELQKIID